MTLINPIQYLTKQGLTISIIDNKLNVKPTHLVTTEIAHYIKQHKGRIKSQLLADSKHVPKLTELTQQQIDWLCDIAGLLKVSPAYLLERKLIDQFDLVELLDKESTLVASSIKAGYYWLKLAN